jgi:hypothetical protein
MPIHKSNLRGFHVRSENIRHRMIVTQEDDLAPGLNPDRAVGFRTRVDTSCATPLWSCNGVVCGGNAKVNVTAKHTLDCPCAWRHCSAIADCGSRFGRFG